MTRGFLSDIVFWSGFPVFTVIGCMHQDQRLKADKVLPPSFFHQTSLLPLQAVLEGKQDVEDVKKEFNAKAALIALLAPLFFL